MSDAVTIQLTGLNGVLKTLQSLPAEIVSKRGGPVKAALLKGAKVILAAERANLQAGLSDDSTGLLLKSLIATRGQPPFNSKGERYLVRVKRQTYKRKGKTVTTWKTAQIREYGSEKEPARPFIRPAFNAKAEEAIRTVESELLARVDKVVAQLAAQNQG